MRSTTNPTALASRRLDGRRERGRSGENALNRSDWVCWNVRQNNMDSLRAETVEDVKILSQLNRLKITLVTGTAAVAFGLAPSTAAGDVSPVLLCLAPLICLYIDCQYYHHLAKIFARAAFMRHEPQLLNETQGLYERFMRQVRLEISPKLFNFEITAQLGSSIIFSSVIPLLGVAQVYLGKSSLTDTHKYIISGLLLGSTILGLGLVLYYYRAYDKSVTLLRQHEPISLETEQDGAPNR